MARILRALKRAILRRVGRASLWYRMRKYARFKPGHVFDVAVDDDSFKLTFLDYRLGNAAIQKAEGIREPETTAIIRSLVKQGGQVLELGSCEGYFTVIMSRCAGARGKVVAIEGTPYYYNLLQHNIRLNQLSNVEAYNLFLTNSVDQVFFNPDDTHPYNAIRSLSQGNNVPGKNKEAVPSSKLSVFLDRIGFVPDYIFMDIEGFEVEVLEDIATSYLTLHRPFIVFEVHPAFYKAGKGLEFIQHTLRDSSYYYRKVAGNLVCFPG